MDGTLPNCWEIKGCGREKGGHHVEDLGECIASRWEMGHSCWSIAGTLCDGEVQGSAAKKIKSCALCEVFSLYDRLGGSKGQQVIDLYPEEHKKYVRQMLKT